MLSIVFDGKNTAISNDFADSCYVLEGNPPGKVYEVWSGKYTAIVMAEDGDKAGTMFNAALASNGIRNSGYSFRVATPGRYWESPPNP